MDSGLDLFISRYSLKSSKERGGGDNRECSQKEKRAIGWYRIEFDIDRH